MESSEAEAIVARMPENHKASLMRDTLDPNWSPPMWFKAAYPGVAVYHAEGLFRGSWLEWTPLGRAVRQAVFALPTKDAPQ
ncbi:MAG: hypothetical protein JWN66_4993 [Sphingomonas bacterium]|nr:hypothetical protein [Sphingomonas bacterium]